MRDPYISLAVPRSATAADIKKSFRELAKRLHPDANNGDPNATALFAELNAAHQILGDEEKRRAFDHGEIDAEGKPTRRAARRSKPTVSRIVTSLMVVMVMLFITAAMIMRGLSPDENINATSEGGDRVLSALKVKEEHALVAQPEQPAPAVQSTPRLILQQGVAYTVADSLPLGVQVSGQADGLALEISGLPSGTTISSGRQLERGGWRILAADVGNATIQPPAGFSGAIDLAVELRLIDDTVVDRGLLHFEWLQNPAVAAERIESTPAAENSADKALSSPPPTDQKAVRDTADSHPDHEPIDLLVGKSEKLIAAGDVEAARSLLQPAAEAHDARAAVALGATYDPIMLAILQARGVAADVSLARDWYEKARKFGSREAQERLDLLASTKVDDGESVSVGSTQILPKVESGAGARDMMTTVSSAKPKRHVVHPPTHVTAPLKSTNPYGVYGAGDRVGEVPDPSIRAQMARDDASRKSPAFFGIGY
jgi:curved DNA-binding protein CbpA